MVVVLPDGTYLDWLKAPAERTIEFLQPYPADQLEATAGLKASRKDLFGEGD